MGYILKLGILILAFKYTAEGRRLPPAQLGLMLGGAFAVFEAIERHHLAWDLLVAGALYLGLGPLILVIFSKTEGVLPSVLVFVAALMAFGAVSFVADMVSSEVAPAAEQVLSSTPAPSTLIDPQNPLVPNPVLNRAAGLGPAAR